MTDREDSPIHAFRAVPRTGVIYVTTEAARLGYGAAGDAGRDWCNLGQGQPETGPLAGAPARIEALTIALDDQEYAPTAGLWELRASIAELYNHLFRRGMPSQYTAENVCVAGGGRTLLTRTAASLGSINLGHFLPDYTAYEELLDIFKAFTPIPILLEGERGYAFSSEDLRKEVRGRGLSALLFSNPCNPTGKVIEGEELSRWVATARAFDCSLLVDEFYSHYVYGNGQTKGDVPVVSAAAYVEDVNKDPVVLFDGLTKNWRYPGWRVTWAVGPRSVIDALSSAGSFLDGGGSKPMQRAALPLMAPDLVKRETSAIQATFRAKRDWLLPRLQNLGVTFDAPTDGTFYAWGNVSALPVAVSTGMGFFRAALAERVITVPGEFFDVNPGKRRRGVQSRFKSYVRFSFGPSQASLEKAVSRLEQVVGRQKA